MNLIKSTRCVNTPHRGVAQNKRTRRRRYIIFRYKYYVDHSIRGRIVLVYYRAPDSSAGVAISELYIIIIISTRIFTFQTSNEPSRYYVLARIYFIFFFAYIISISRRIINDTFDCITVINNTRAYTRNVEID